MSSARRRQRELQPVVKGGPLPGFEQVAQVRARAAAGLNPKDIALVKKILGQVQENLKAPKGLEEAI